jgi:hypothetical protein
MEILIKGQEHPIKFGFRQLIIFEEKNGGPIDELKGITKMQLFLLYHSAIEAGYKRHGRECPLNIEDIIDACDDDPTLLTQLAELNAESQQPKK